MADAKKMRLNVADLNSRLEAWSAGEEHSRSEIVVGESYHSTNPGQGTATRSFMNHAAGKPVTRVASPRMRNVQGSPTF